VVITLYQGGSPYSTIEPSTSDDGSYLWPIPAGLALNTYTIRVAHAADTSRIYDDSNSFSIIPANTNPTITHPSDFSYYQGTTGHQIAWTITDTTVLTTQYSILRDGVVVASGSWTSGVDVNINVDGFTDGLYNYTIIADDGRGASVRDEVWITVQNPAPAITNPLDITYNCTTAGHSISWTVTDTVVGTTAYEILRNGSQVATGSWISGAAVPINVDGLAVGSYNFTILAQDGLGKSVVDTVYVMVLNPTPIITPLADFVYNFTTTGHSISWTVTDPSVGTTQYEILRNGSQVATGSWISGAAVPINVDGLAVGSYNFTILAQDGLGKSVVDTAIVTVQNPTPGITHPADLNYAIGKQDNLIRWTITDESIGATTTYIIEVDGSFNRTSTWISGETIDFYTDSFEIGTYNVTIMANDGLGRIVRDTVFVYVNPSTPTEACREFLGLCQDEWETAAFFTTVSFFILSASVSMYVKKTKVKGKKEWSKKKKWGIILLCSCLFLTACYLSFFFIDIPVEILQWFNIIGLFT
jgi:hypothetical protein